MARALDRARIALDKLWAGINPAEERRAALSEAVLAILKATPQFAGTDKNQLDAPMNRAFVRELLMHVKECGDMALKHYH